MRYEMAAGPDPAEALGESLVRIQAVAVGLRPSCFYGAAFLVYSFLVYCF